jgi:hypothetical protein
MQQPKDVRSHFEAGIALLYGEIGALLDRLDALRDVLPNQIKQAKLELEQSAITIAKSIANMQSIADKQESQITRLFEQEKTKQLDAMRIVLAEALSKYSDQANKIASQRDSNRTNLIVLLAVGIGLLSGIIGAFIGVTYLH